MWQALFEELRDQGFMVVTVAMDSRGVNAVRGPIRRAKTTHTSLVDRDHVVAELYNMVNVPQAVWIDESGKIVRPTEVSGFQVSLNLRKVQRTRRRYLDAIRDWVENGPESEHVFSEAEARDHLRPYTAEIALAHANFHLGRYLWERGDRSEGARLLRCAVELHPDSWNFFRQMKNLEYILGSGGPAYLRRVRQRSKQGHVYYELPDMAVLRES